MKVFAVARLKRGALKLLVEQMNSTVKWNTEQLRGHWLFMMKHVTLSEWSQELIQPSHKSRGFSSSRQERSLVSLC